MSTSTAPSAELSGQTVPVIGGSSGIGLATALRARREGAEVILSGRNPDRLEAARREVDARAVAAFDVNDANELQGFFDGLKDPLDQITRQPDRAGVRRHPAIGGDPRRRA